MTDLMLAKSDPSTDREPVRSSSSRPVRGGRTRQVPWPVILASSAVGILIVGLSFRMSAAGLPAGAYYATFWAGVLAAVVPLGARLMSVTTTRRDRGWLIALLGGVTAVPKYLRNPTQPLYHDEYAHWREAIDVLTTGHLLRPNSLIPIVEFFPGTSALTAVVDRITGLSVWSSGQIVVSAAHILGLFAVFVLGEVHLRSARAGALASLVYALNPSAMYFDTQYAYESVAIGFFLWVLALTSLAARTDRSGQRFGLTAAASLCSAGCVVTHHLTALFLLVVLVIVSATVAIRPRLAARRSARAARSAGAAPDPEVTDSPAPDSPAPDDPAPTDAAPGHEGVWSVVLMTTVGLGLLWVLLVARETITYLSPYFGGSVRQLTTLASSKGGGRVVLAASVQPWWERGLTALAPVVVGVIAVIGAQRWRRERTTWSSMTTGLIVFGLIYFPSVPFILAPSGAEGARRSWAFTYVGISLLLSMVLLAPGSVDRPRGRWSQLGIRWRTAATVAVLGVLLIGNVGGGLNDPYRFPGQFKWGSDTDSASDEARTVARLLGDEAGPVRVVSDAYTALQLVAYGGLSVAAPSTGFPAWDLVETDRDPSPALAEMLSTSAYNYLVVDIRMGEQAPFNGSNFGPSDPLPGVAIPMANLTRLDHVPWASRVMATEHLRVYRLDLGKIGSTVRVGS